jgi:hypothetical protein
MRLDHIDLPPITTSADRPEMATATYAQRCDRLYEQAGLDWLVVYGDREHSGNLVFLSGFDPRFEESLLLLGPARKRVLVVGNEGAVYAPLAGLEAQVMLAQTLSLPGQSRAVAPRLADVLAAAGLTPGCSAGVAGWKYTEPDETAGPPRPSFIPALIVNAVGEVCGDEPSDITSLLINPRDGIRVRNGPDQIALFEWEATRAAQAVLGVVSSARPGHTEFEAVAAMSYAGDPLSAHVMFASGTDSIIGLRSPSGRSINKGDGATTAIGYWGGLTCRAGLIDDHGPEFLESVAVPYMNAMFDWYELLEVGVEGGVIHSAIDTALADVPFASFLNPGHLIGIEEWLHTPVRPGSTDPIVSGMAIQSDIIPSPMPPGWAANCEDTLAIADPDLRGRIATEHPELWARIVARQAFMRTELGIDLSDSVLPLSGTNGYYFPFWLDPQAVLTRR